MLTIFNCSHPNSREVRSRISSRYFEGYKNMSMFLGKVLTFLVVGYFEKVVWVIAFANFNRRRAMMDVMHWEGENKWQEKVDEILQLALIVVDYLDDFENHVIVF